MRPCPAGRTRVPERRWPAALLALLALAWLASLGTRALISADEGRYATLALQMLQSGDWITPRLNGLLYFEKPPLQYWGGAVSMALFGVSEFSARLWPGLAGIGTVALVGLTARRLWGAQAGIDALFIAAATTWIVGNSHFLSLDAGLTCALTLVLCGVLVAERVGLETPAATRWVLAAWVGMALGVLSKGPIAVVIPGAVLVLHSAWRRELRLWRHLRWSLGLPLFAVVVLPWFVAVSLRNPDFARFFFIHEHLERYLTPVHRREGSLGYFVPYLLVGALPWTAALPWLLRARRADFASSLLVTWVGFVLVFFSLSDSKLPSYILPVFPALALLAARRFDTTSTRGLALVLGVPAAIWACALIALPQTDRFFSAGTPAAAVDAMRTAIALAAVLFLAAAAWAALLLRQSRRHSALAVVAAAHCIALLVVMQSHDSFGQVKSARQIGQVLADQAKPLPNIPLPVFAVRDYDQTLPFYLRRSVVLVDYRDEFAFGQSHEPERWIPTLEGFALRWRSEPAAAAYMSRPTFELLQRQGLPMRAVFEDARRIVVVKP